jgi:UDP-N-acetylmuramate--alanine ligase
LITELFDVKDGILKDLLWITWKHNLMNALMAIAMAVNFTPTDAIAKALASFKGIRRFFYQIKTDNLVYR